MPLLELTTNVQLPDAKAFSLELSKVGAEALGKPEAYISVIIKYNETLTFGGTHDPAFQMMVISLGNINPAATEKYSKALSEFLNQKLGLSNDRGYMYVRITLERRAGLIVDHQYFH
ncbi:Tautomerase/MIF superfamily [Schizophyllum amplum]|uniref:L-dopachrome isomerase n=1 Tax=Schizophyllum amplum TaxID=97359 RepID=A0A550C511_9AGAR|nr:Tautomerase/MIF superfamily [Auriculariopsis ampla]